MYRVLLIISLLSILLGCNEEIVKTYKAASPIEKLQSSDYQIKTSHYNEALVLIKGEKKKEIFIGEKWKRILPEYIRVKSSRLLIVPLRKCFLSETKKSYSFALVDLENQEEVREIFIEKKEWLGLELPLCEFETGQNSDKH